MCVCVCPRLDRMGEEQGEELREEEAGLVGVGLWRGVATAGEAGLPPEATPTAALPEAHTPLPSPDTHTLSVPFS